APDGIWDALIEHAQTAGYEVIRNRRGSENGFCDFSNKQIAVRPDVAPAQAVKTLIHEIAHALLHGEGIRPSREIAEVAVESVAFIVCDAIGLDTGDYSFAYVARWTDGEVDMVKATADRVVACARSIIAGVGEVTSGRPAHGHETR
ncbi:MAG: ImmA/IrrE family metallo-endopeptidase, partial [Actinomycetota bacterium]